MSCPSLQCLDLGREKRKWTEARDQDHTIVTARPKEVPIAIGAKTLSLVEPPLSPASCVATAIIAVFE